MMTSPKGRIYPRESPDIYVTMSEDDLALVAYDRLDSKSAEELLYEAAIQTDPTIAERKWKAFQGKVDSDFLTNKEIYKIVHNLDEQKQWSALHYAVTNNNIFLANILTGKTYRSIYGRYKCDMNILGGNGESVLHVAAQSHKIWERTNNDQLHEFYRSRNVVSYLVRNYESQTLEENIPPMIKLLVEQRWYETSIHVNHEDEEGRTALHLAVMGNRHSFVAYLLKNGARLDATTKINANVFHFIFVPSDPLQTEFDLENMITSLYEIAEDQKKLHLLHSRTLDNRSPLVLAVCHPQCNQKIIKILTVKKDTNQFLLAFDFAAKKHIRDLNLLKPMLDYFISYANNQKNKLAQIACHYDNVEMLKWLADETNDNTVLMKSYAGYTPLLTAVFYDAKKCVNYLLTTTYIEWKKQNHDGETILHILSKRTDKDLELFHLIMKEIPLNERKDLIILEDNAGNTPLHCAARSNQFKICKELLIITDEMKNLSISVIDIINKRNSLGQTAAHVACEMGHKDIVEFFWEITNKDRTTGLFKRDDDRKSCLHVAAAKGHLNVVEYLVTTVKMDVDMIADRRVSPLHLACQYGHSKVVQYLLDHNASSTLRDARLYNCLEIAIMNHQDKLVQEVLFNHSLWRDMMRNAQPIKDTKAYDTPMRKLIRYMPQVTIHVIDTKLTRIIGAPGQKVYKRIYDYEFFQDELSVERWYTQGANLDSSPKSFYERYKKLSWTEKIRCACCCFCCTNPNSNPNHSNDSKPYTDNSYVLVRNHPLFITAHQSECPDLIQHPFNICLRTKKFHMFGKYLLILSCLLYTIYLGVYTALILLNKHPQYFYNLINVNYTDDFATCESVSKILANGTNTTVFKTDPYKILRWIAFGFLIIFIIKNTLLIISLFPKLLRMGTYYLEIAVLVLSFVYILDWFDWLGPLLLRCPVQYQIGSFGLLLAWINFLTYVRYIPFARIGIYVVMLQVILWKFLQFLPVLLIIICGFGLTYWMLLQNQTVYQTPLESIIRTGFMMFDLGYEDRLYKPSEGGIGYYIILYVIFILTAIVLSIFVINLLISLAVGELPSLNDQSVVWRHQMMYNLLSDYEILRIQLRPLFDCFTCGYLNRTQRRGPHICKFLQRRQDVTVQRDENEVFWLIRFGRYAQKHFFEERIQDNVKQPTEKKEKKEDKEKD